MTDQKTMTFLVNEPAARLLVINMPMREDPITGSVATILTVREEGVEVRISGPSYINIVDHLLDLMGPFAVETNLVYVRRIGK